MPDLTTRTGWSDPAARPRDETGRGLRSWRRVLAANPLTVILSLWLLVPLIYWPSAVALDALWRGSAGDTYTHGYLVLIASLWLTVRERGRLQAAPARPAGWGLAPVILLSVAWLWSWRAAIEALHMLLLPAILAAALVAALGWRTARLALFPVGLLLFAMPIWGAINGILQALASRVNGLLIWLSGMPAYMQGNVIRLPGGSIDIAQTCSGLNAFVIGLTVAALYGAITRDPLRRRLAWLGLMGALALIGNSVRIFIVTVAAYQTDMRSPLVAHHIWLGWCLFAVAVGVFLALAGRLAGMWDRGRPAKARAEERPAEAPAGPMTAAPPAARLAVVLGCLALLPVLSYGSDLLTSAARGQIAIQWPAAPHGWRGPMPDTASEWSPRFLSASAQSLRVYVDAGAEPIEVFTVAYRSQTQDAKLLGYGNSLLGSAEQLQGRAQRSVDSPAGRWRERVAVDPAGARSLIWWRYRVGDRVFTEPRLSQLWYGLAALLGHPPVSSITALRAACGTDCSAARRRLEAAAARLQPVLTLRRDGVPVR
jgi:EpsI family protein